MRSVRIGVNLYPSVGGSGNLATRLGEHLARRGHQVHFISYQKPFALMWQQPKGIYVDLVDNFDYPLFKDIGSPYGMALASKNARVAQSAHLDLIPVSYTHLTLPTKA